MKGIISKKEFDEAMVIVAAYSNQINEIKHRKEMRPCDIGCRVQLNKYGIEMQGKSKSKLTGTVIDYLSWGSGSQKWTDGLSTVKWDGKSMPDTMHVSHLKTIINTPPVSDSDTSAHST